MTGTKRNPISCGKEKRGFRIYRVLRNKHNLTWDANFQISKKRKIEKLTDLNNSPEITYALTRPMMVRKSETPDNKMDQWPGN